MSKVAKDWNVVPTARFMGDDLYQAELETRIKQIYESEPLTFDADKVKDILELVGYEVHENGYHFFIGLRDEDDLPKVGDIVNVIDNYTDHNIDVTGGPVPVTIKEIFCYDQEVAEGKSIDDIQTNPQYTYCISLEEYDDILCLTRDTDYFDKFSPKKKNLVSKVIQVDSNPVDDYIVLEHDADDDKLVVSKVLMSPEDEPEMLNITSKNIVKKQY